MSSEQKVEQKLFEIEKILQSLTSSTKMGVRSSERLANNVETLASELPMIVLNIERVNSLSETVKFAISELQGMKTDIEVMKTKQDISNKITYGAVSMALASIGNSIFKII